MIVQTSPAWPAYAEHSLVTWSSPLRGRDAEASEATVPDPVAARLETTGLALGLVGPPGLSAHPTAASAVAQKHAMTTRGRAGLMIPLLLIASGGFEPGCVEFVMSDERVNDVKMRI